MDWLKKIPVLAALTGEGLKSSEGVGIAGVVTLAAPIALSLAASDMDWKVALAKGIGLLGLGVLGFAIGKYAEARATVKAVAAKEGA